MSNDNNADDKDLEGFDPAKVDPETATPEQVTQLVKFGQTAQAQKGHWKEKAIDPATGKPWSEVAAELQQKGTPSPTITPTATEQKPDIEVTVAGLKESEDKRQFQEDHGLTRAETDMVFAQAKGMGIEPAKALETPFVKSGLKGLKDAREASSATPRPSGRSPQVDGKPVEKLTEDEKRENWPVITGAKKA